MKSPSAKRRSVKGGYLKKSLGALFGGLLIVLLIGGTIWKLTVVPEPEFQKRSLSNWLDELSAFDSSRRYDSNTPAVRAVRAIGTNGIPWLMHELQADTDTFRSTVNALLDKQSIVKRRFLDSNSRLARATLGFETLGPIAEPAIPDLLASVERFPGYIPTALAGIGEAAIPALQICLTNGKEYATSRGPFSPIPGNTIGGVFNAKQRGRLSASQIAPLLHQIRELSQSTNSHAAAYARTLLQDIEQSSQAGLDALK
jgi:hypothetical protein